MCIRDSVKELRDRLGLTIVVVSHDIGQVERIADHVILVAAGRSEGQWSREGFFSGEGERARRFISGRL